MTTPTKSQNQTILGQGVQASTQWFGNKSYPLFKSFTQNNFLLEVNEVKKMKNEVRKSKSLGRNKNLCSALKWRVAIVIK
jgi:hypothetical protein